MAITIDLDIKGAFDNIQTEAVIKAMDRKKVEDNIKGWYSDYLYHRTCEANLGDSTSMAKLTRGCPQGGVASPVLSWDFPYDEFLEAYDGSAVEQFGFADDGKLIITGFDFDMMLKLAQWAINVAVQWAQKVGVSFSIEKTTVMFFNRGLFRPVAETRLSLYNSPLEWSKETKYLGITFDSTLSFQIHIENKIASAKRKLMMLGNVCRNTWGPNPRAIRWAYTGIVRPAIAYGCVVWADKAQTEKTIAKLSSLQRLALLQIAPVRKSTPTAALELLYDVLPLHLFLKEHALKTALRLEISPKWFPRDTKGHQHKLLDSLPNEIRGCKMDNARTSTIWEQNYEVLIGMGDDIPIKRDWTCYTDGSKVGKRAGSGGIILRNGEEFKKVAYSVGQAEVFQAEVSAIAASAKILVEENVLDSKIDILSDSQASLKALANHHTISDSVRNAKKVLNDLGKQNEIKLHYIAAHKGWEFNEIADKQANLGRKMGEDPENIPQLSKRSMHSVIESMVRQEWKKSWDDLLSCRQTKYFVEGPSKARAMLLLQNSREVLGRLVRYITGHAFLRQHNAIVFHNLNPPPGDNSCRMCEDSFHDETPHHLITECDRLCMWRNETLGGYVLDDFPNWDPRDLTKFLCRKDIILLETDSE